MAEVCVGVRPATNSPPYCWNGVWATVSALALTELYRARTSGGIWTDCVD